MYGLVNRAVKDLITENFGAAKWQEVAISAGVDEEFISMESYNDEVTYHLVGAASELLDIPAAELLRQFGNYWIRFTADEGYGHILSLFGDTLDEFLARLGNDLHGRVAVTMPELKPPQFRTEKIAQHTYLVEYKSHRKGLMPMVHGLLEGLAIRFGESANITHKRSDQEGSMIIETFEVEIVHH